VISLCVDIVAFKGPRFEQLLLIVRKREREEEKERIGRRGERKGRKEEGGETSRLGRSVGCSLSRGSRGSSPAPP